MLRILGLSYRQFIWHHILEKTTFVHFWFLFLRNSLFVNYLRMQNRYQFRLRLVRLVTNLKICKSFALKFIIYGLYLIYTILYFISFNVAQFWHFYEKLVRNFSLHWNRCLSILRVLRYLRVWIRQLNRKYIF